MDDPQKPAADSPSLIRGMGLGSATALNMIDMIGVGPFITMPLVVAAMGGPQAILGWIFGALFAMCDGLVWAELGAAMPGSGGSYRFLRETYGPQKLGRLISFLFIWQLSFSAPLSIASGCIGLAGYAAYYWPGMDTIYAYHEAALRLPWAGPLQVSWIVTPGTSIAVAICLFTVFLLYRNITVIGRLSKALWFGVMGTMAWIIFAGLTHFNAAQAFDSPPERSTSPTDSSPAWAAPWSSLPTIIGVTAVSASSATRSRIPARTFPALSCFPFSSSPVYIS